MEADAHAAGRNRFDAHCTVVFMARILMLGGSGFIGSYMARRFLNAGHEVTSVDNFSKYGMLKHDYFDNKRFRHISSDIRTMSPAEYKGYDYVFCLAALIGGIGYIQRIPYQIAKVNTQILTSAIDATLAAAPDATFVYFSSSMVYQRAQKEFVEADAYNQLVPTITYGLQKLFGEFIVTGANQEYGMKYVIVRPFNVVGGGEMPKFDAGNRPDFGNAHVVPDFVYKALTRQSPFEIMGDGKQIRTLTHVEDFADAMDLLVKKKVKNEDFNICGDEPVTVADLAMRTWKKVNMSMPFPGFKHLKAPNDDVRFRIGKTYKARKLLGWSPKRGVDDVLDDSIKSMRAYLEPK